MLIVAFLYMVNSFISAAPVSSVLRDAILPDFNSPAGQCACTGDQRTVWEILWSCLATILACTWVSVHSNIPPSGEKWWKIGLRRLELMFWALIAPEMIIFWAMRQWNGARAMVEKYHGRAWTKTHAYFIQMGGFTLFEGGRPKAVLLPDKMEKLLLEGRIDLPQITEEEFHDRSKGDAIAKTLLIGQTSWFIAQCIARRAQGLILTELELVAGTFAVLNGVMYFLWWNKPLDIRWHVPVHLLDKLKSAEDVSRSTQPTDHHPHFESRCRRVIRHLSHRKTIRRLHCATWFFSFPSRAESILWRVCSAVISIIPLGMLIAYMANFCDNNIKANSTLKTFLESVLGISGISILCLPICYCAPPFTPRGFWRPPIPSARRSRGCRLAFVPSTHLTEVRSQPDFGPPHFGLTAATYSRWPTAIDSCILISLTYSHSCLIQGAILANICIAIGP
ncbi:hypothetical protein GALMADRAFT_435041 [Galerina marginata CBS 339.88]|uniref:Uncharacterized protein n=1 Tax=Galerina marginata (strain CBS 339.88) TaxID=685588 RepID=A0A067T4B2_GALM3|nr:hypothetical protein GALMADRAFT_435041 [Galerina marginata CBS 339.88]